jgi:hypothetical protein
VRVVELGVMVAVLFGTGFGVGIATRAMVAHRQARGARKLHFRPQFRFTSSLKASELCEDPIWGR